MRAPTFCVTTALVCAGFAAAMAGEQVVETKDGLAMRIRDDGRIACMAIDGRVLPAAGAVGGFEVLDVHSAKGVDLVANGGFDETKDDWPVGWGRVAKCWRLDTEVRHSGRASMRVAVPGTDPSRSPNVALLRRFPVKGEADYRVQFWLRTQSCFREGQRPSAPAVYTVEYDGEGKSLRQTSYYRPKYQPTMDWFLASRLLRTHPEARSMGVYMNLYRAYGTAWVDDIAVYELGSEWQTSAVQVEGKWRSEEGGIVQSARIDSLGLQFGASYRAAGSHIQ